MKKHLKYKGVTIGAFGLPILFSNRKTEVESKKTLRKYSEYKHFDSNFSSITPKKLIVIYDIPISRRSDRDWLRYQLRKFEYIMIQNSVWVGPSPLPKDFINYLKSIGILNKLNFLELAKPYLKENIKI